ncbi:MAG: PAS domain S-box protein [Scytonematopsis contorta HA4267-MV1]|jgi:PAS domain S-box-containing protein|nr:PAS domain S-box protein [Scytonematopsis contorta HA4267-MV1]
MNQSTFPDESQENYKTLPKSDFCMELLLPIINSISDPIFVKDREHRWVFLNDAFCNFLSYSREQLIGKSDYDFFPKEEADIFWEKDELVFTTGLSNENEESFTDRNGFTRIISTKKTLLEDALGNKYIIGIIRDITINVKKYQRTKIALLQTEERFQKFAANVPGMLYQHKLDVDGSTSFTYVSSGCYELFGFTPEQIKADANLIVSTIHPNDIDSFYQATKISTQTLQSFRWEGRYILPSGELKYLKAESRLEKQPDGSIIWDGLITDITRLKETEKSLQQAYGEMEIIVLERTKKLALINAELQTKIAELEITQSALRESESKLQKLAENLPGMVYTFKLMPDGSMFFPYVSSGCYEIYQLTPEEIKSDLNLAVSRTHHGDCENFLKSVALSAQTMEPWQWEGRIILPSGQIKWVKGESCPEKQSDGSILWYGVLLDVTVQKQAEFALQESESQYRNLVETSQDIIWSTDVKGNFTFINQAATKVYGYDLEEIIGRHFTEFLPPEQHEKDLEVFRDLSSGESKFQYETVSLTKDGRLLNVLVNAITLRDNQGNIIGITGINSNITERKKVEKEKARLVAILESTPDYAGITNAEGNFIYMNPAGRKMLGINENEDISKIHFREIHAPHIVKILPQEMPRLLSEGIWKGEGCLLHRNGKEIPISQIVIAHKNENGEVEYLSAISRDITDIKSAEVQLKQSQQRLARLIEQTPIGVMEFNPQGEFIEWNPAAEKIFGYTKDEVRGQTFKLIVPESGRTKIGEIGKAVLANAGGTYNLNENITKDGKIIICEWHNSSLVDADGNVVGVVSMVLDITERKEDEAELQHSKHLLEEAQRIANIGNWEFDVATKTVTWSNETFRIFGLETGQPVPPPSESILMYHPDDRALVQFVRSKAAKEGKASDIEARIFRPDGSQRNINLKVEPIINDQGEIVRVMGTILDITARKQVEAQLRKQTQELQQALDQLQRTQIQLVQTEKMSSLGQLVAGIAHEINNPTSFIYGNLCHADEYIQDILGLIKLYQQNNPQPESHIRKFAKKIEIDFLMEDLPKLMDSMKNGAERIRCIVLSLRNFSRLDEAEMKAVDIHEGLDSTLMILQHRFKANGSGSEIQIIKEYAKLPLVECYAGQLNQVFINILTNAVDALEESFVNSRLSFVDKTSNSNPQIHIYTELTQDNTAKISIYDNGYGIPENTIKRLFDPFFTTKPVGKGTGMGLSVSYQIITEKHHGSLQCFSRLGKGAKFVIAIPLVQLQG